MQAFTCSLFRSKSERYIFLALHSTVSTEWRYTRTDEPTLTLQTFFPRERDHEYDVEHIENRFIIRTNWQAPNFRVMEVACGARRGARPLA